ncbi:MAG: efflux RND transporter periplasmic adaptor subunit [Eubacterium sp.]|nr:efflux RND transporter periplasmic adaptor subunit [Eubacterium sp.]
MKKRPLLTRIRYTTALFLAGVLTVSSLTGCLKKKEKKSLSDIKVDTCIAETGRLEISTDYIATLSPNLTVDVVPLAAGTVEQIPVKVGDRVREGDLLCQLDDTSADLSVQSARDAVKSARAGKEAAQSQTDTAKIQADANVKTLKKTLKTYKSSLDTAEKQLEKLKNSRNTVKKSQAAAQKTLAAAKKRFKTAQRLLVQFEAFLNNNPDCKTTAGLTAAATTVSYVPQTPSQPVPAAAPDNPAAENNAQAQGNNNPAADNNAQAQGNNYPAAGPDSSVDAAASQAKQKQAQALMSALTEAGLTVEYLRTTGLEALKGDAEDAQTAFTGSGSGLSQLDTSIATLKTNISQLKGQISATKDSLATAEKLAEAASAGSEVYDAQIEAAKTGVEAAQYQKDLYRLTAPINGIVDAVNVKEHGMASQGLAAFTISEKDSMIAAFYVTEDVKNFLKIGDQAALIRKEDDEQAQDLGHIISIGTAVDPQKGLFKVEAEFVTTGQKELSSGSSVKLSIVSNAVSGELLIPYDSVYYDDGQAYVYKVTDGKALRTDIETGLFNEKYITVASGLAEGDCIITTWASGLKDGAKVKVMSGEDSK